MLGGMYEFGEGVAEDPGQAVLWYRKAAEQGNKAAQVSLRWSYFSGCLKYHDGVFEDHSIFEDDQRAMMCRKTAERGISGAQAELGLMYAYGAGVPQDIVQAYAWWNLAAAQGHRTAEEDLARIGRNDPEPDRRRSAS